MLQVSHTAEVVHVLYLDLVGYSLQPMEAQREQLTALQDIVRGVPGFRAAEAAGELMRLPTGDGMALVFWGDHLAPVRCAMELSRDLRREPLAVRMGIHTGPCERLPDINANDNVYGAGINEAQRVMSCGDAGHILLSRGAADMWLQRGGADGLLHDLGDYRVKHGRLQRIYSLHSAEVGNPRRPRQPLAWQARNVYFRYSLVWVALYALMLGSIYFAALTHGRALGQTEAAGRNDYTRPGRMPN